MRNKDYGMSFLDYLKEKDGKFVILLSRNQYAIEVDHDFTHDGMVTDLINKTRPNIPVDKFGVPLDDDNSYVDDSFFMLGYHNQIFIELQAIKKLSKEQYDVLSEILHYIDEYNKGKLDKFRVFALGNEVNGIEAEFYENDINGLLEKVKTTVVESLDVPDEIIIGRRIHNEKDNTIDVDKIVEEMANNEHNNEPTEYVKTNIKGYSSIIILTVLTSLISICIIIFGIFLNI